MINLIFSPQEFTILRPPVPVEFVVRPDPLDLVRWLQTPIGLLLVIPFLFEKFLSMDIIVDI